MKSITNVTVSSKVRYKYEIAAKSFFAVTFRESIFERFKSIQLQNHGKIVSFCPNHLKFSGQFNVQNGISKMRSTPVKQMKRS